MCFVRALCSRFRILEHGWGELGIGLGSLSVFGAKLRAARRQL